MRCNSSYMTNLSVISWHSFKELVHVLPYLLPPIARRYTIRFFTQGNRDFFTKAGKYKGVAFPLDKEDQFSAFKDY